MAYFQTRLTYVTQQNRIMWINFEASSKMKLSVLILLLLIVYRSHSIPKKEMKWIKITEL